jgi:hypothetical protein
VREYLIRARRVGLGWPLPEEWGDAELEARLLDLAHGQPFCRHRLSSGSGFEESSRRLGFRLSSVALAQVDGFDWNRWTDSIGIGGRLPSERVDEFDWNTQSYLSAWWVRLGITPELIEPGKPQQNGRHERMHRTLKAETARPPSSNLASQQARFNRFKKVYNEERPHDALELETPASCYVPSPRPYPEGKLSPPIYPAHYEIRKVAGDKTIKWHDRKVFVSELLIRDHIGFEEVADGEWSVYFGPVHLGWFDERDYRIMDSRGPGRKR